MISHELEMCLNIAINEAQKYGHEYVTVEHVLFALMFDTKSERIIRACGGSVEQTRNDLISFFKNNLENNVLKEASTPRPTIGFQRVLKRAAEHIISAGKDKIYGDSVLVAIFAETDSFAAYFLERQKISRFDVVNFISHGVTKDRQADETVVPTELPMGVIPPDEERKVRPPGEEGENWENNVPRDKLALYTENLTAKARQGKIDPFVGRTDELDRTVQVLCRRRKNNPLYIGDSGVGKTALVEGLAQKIVAEQVPEVLRGAEIFALDLAGLIAGTKFRGEFEDRLKKVLKSLKKIPKAILFIDEIHTIIGAGSVSGGSMDAANILKPFLSSGQIRCIGSTTYKEFRQHFESDHAMNRRFQKISVEEPSEEDAIKILQGLKAHYESFHGVHYTPEAIRGAVELSNKYLRERKLPDKAIDLIDEVGASFVARSMVKPGKKRPKVTLNDIKMQVAKIARIPATRLSASDKKALRTLGDELKEFVFGQDKAIEGLVTTIRMARSGLGTDDKPIGSFLFSGPTGVGKTELAKQLAARMGIEFIRFDMSEYMERHTVSRLIGAPPGYVGYEEGGLLTDAVHKQPHAVLLLDEIEKAHSDVINVLLQVMDRGVLTDSSGRETDFRNIVIIMTTNVGAAELSRTSIGFDRTGDEAGKDSAAIRKAFTPEFRNRLSGVFSFGVLAEATMLQIVDKFLAELRSKLVSKHVELKVSDAARKYLAKEGYEPANGARPLGRVIERLVKRPLSEAILFGALAKGGVATIDMKGDVLDIVCEPS